MKRLRRTWAVAVLVVFLFVAWRATRPPTADQLFAEIERLAAAALASQAVKEATGGRHWRELYVASPVTGTVKFRFTPVGWGSGFQIDDVYVDPFRNR